jgi:hypothetical protein
MEACSGDEGQYAGGKHFRNNPVHRHPRPVGTTNSEMNVLLRPQAVEMTVLPLNDIFVIAGRHRAAHNRKHRFAERVQCLVLQAIILNAENARKRSRGALRRSGFLPNPRKPLNHSKVTALLKSEHPACLPERVAPGWNVARLPLSPGHGRKARLG